MLPRTKTKRHCGGSKCPGFVGSVEQRGSCHKPCTPWHLYKILGRFTARPRDPLPKTKPVRVRLRRVSHCGQKVSASMRSFHQDKPKVERYGEPSAHHKWRERSLFRRQRGHERTGSPGHWSRGVQCRDSRCARYQQSRSHPSVTEIGSIRPDTSRAMGPLACN